MRTKILVTVGFALLVSFLVTWLVRSMGPSSEQLTVRVETRDFRVRVEAPGKLESGNALYVEAQAHGSVLTYIAPEGKHVTKGEVLARFDDTALRERVLMQRNDLRMAEARLAEKRVQQACRVRENAAEITVRRAELAIKRTQFRRLRSLPIPDDIARAELERDYRASQFRIAEQDLENIRSLMERDSKIFSQEELREKQMAYTTARAELEKSENLLTQVRRGASVAELDAAQRDLNKAEIDLAEAVSNQPVKDTILQAEVAQAEAEVEKMKARLERTEKELDQFEVKSPGDGVLVYRTLHGRPLELGAQVWHRAHLFDVADLSTMVVRAKVSESEFSHIREGQSAEIRVYSVPDRVFTGKVTEVAKVAEDRSASHLTRWGAPRAEAGIQAFDVLVSIDEQHAHLTPNVEAEVMIHCVEVPDAVVVPIDATFRRHNVDYVHVVSGRRARPREVTLGQRSRDWVVVTSGLEAGERVLLASPTKEGT
ncbi:MAG TPA: efflux RND transporter periplasmic adaptor subunit [Planctomycetota bacterium]|nr:efflux RND transporter periplasmic adaptor subunit [Planctomycetota bacterium]